MLPLLLQEMMKEAALLSLLSPVSRWLMTAEVHPKILPLCFKDRCLLPCVPDALRCDDYFGGRLEAVFSPFPYWWWRRCLLWPPVWWCTLHLHNVSVRREEKTREDRRREVLFGHIMILLTPFSHWEWDTLTRDKKVLFRGSKVELGAVRYRISQLDAFSCLYHRLSLPHTHCLLGYALRPWIWMQQVNEWINECTKSEGKSQLFFPRVKWIHPTIYFLYQVIWFSIHWIGYARDWSAV